MRSRYLLWALVVLWLAVLFIMSGQSAEESSTLSGGVIEVFASVFNPSFKDMDVTERAVFVDQLQGVVRKFAHYLSYLLLGVLVTAAMWTYTFGLRRKLVWSFLFGFLYAVVDEVQQYFVPGRSMQFGDVLIDSLGIVTGITIFYLISLLLLRKDP